MNFEDCKNPKELYDAIEGNPTYKLMSRDIAYRPEDFRWYRGKASIPILGITEEIDFEKLQHPKQIYKHAKLCVLRLQEEYPVLKTAIFSNEEDPLTGLQNIMQSCKAASDGKDKATLKPAETEQGATPANQLDEFPDINLLIRTLHEDRVKLCNLTLGFSCVNDLDKLFMVLIRIDETLPLLGRKIGMDTKPELVRQSYDRAKTLTKEALELVSGKIFERDNSGDTNPIPPSLRFSMGDLTGDKLKKYHTEHSKFFGCLANQCNALGFLLNALSKTEKPTEASSGRNSAETGRDTKRIIAAILISLFIICVFILSVWLVPFTPFTWLKNHPNSYGLQGSIIFMIPSLIVGLFKPQWRNWCWGTAFMAFLVLILSLLGGRSSQ